ncbi:MAG: PucR family transcriptional regulator ligand-binding domain-containing protein [Anaerolineales bacterium]|nr:PucR family transcriptional regulator ligand-binding domain-containing protein [Anaerolineales bacterium]
MLTLRQALKLPCFSRARVVAGQGGLDREVRRVHVIDIPDATYNWGQGALLLTAGYGLKDSPERQAALIPQLVDKGLVGLVFSVGWYFEAVPAVIRAAADAHALPVIQVPPDIQFIDITERLYVEIINEQAALKERASDIHRRLTELALKGGDLTALAETLAGILERSVLIDGAAFEVLAHAQHGPVDESRQRAIRQRRTPADILRRLIKRGLYADLQANLRPRRVEALPELGMTMERIVAPVVGGGEIYGYIWIVAGDRPLTELDELAIDHAATVAALVLLKEQAVMEAQQAQRGDFLAQLLRPDAALDRALLERAHLMGFQIERPHQALFVACPPGGAPAGLATPIQRWLRPPVVERALVATREQGVVVVIEAASPTAGQELAHKLLKHLSGPTQPLVIGVGQVHPEDRFLRRSYDEAVSAAEIGQRLSQGAAAVYCHWELGLLDWLYRLPPEVLGGNLYLQHVQTLATHDRDHRSDLVNTLEAYLEHGGALAEAAASLNVHRNTLLYRLERIEEIAGVDLRNVQQRLNLYVALKSYRLQK